MFSTLTIIVCSAVAFVAGFIDSIAGGGGLITMPAVLLAGVPPHLALGTNKLSAAMGTITSLIAYTRRGYVRWKVVPLGIAASLLGSAAGSQLTMLLSSETLGKWLLFMLPVGMIATLLPKRERQGGQAPEGGRLWLLLGLTSFAVGLYDGFFGPGAGSFYILAFHWILFMGLVEASGTAKALNLASNVGALVVFLVNGQVSFLLGIPMAAANMAGNWLGSNLAMRFGARAVRVFLALSLSILLLTLFWRYFAGQAASL